MLLIPQLKTRKHLQTGKPRTCKWGAGEANQLVDPGAHLLKVDRLVADKKKLTQAKKTHVWSCNTRKASNTLRTDSVSYLK